MSDAVISSSQSASPPAPADRRRWMALGVLALVQFMLVLDVTVVNVALPHIQTDLGFSRAGLAWVVDGYVLTAGGFILLGGRLGDLLGRRRLFIGGVLLFAVASALSGASTSPGMLVASRFLQGLGEALSAPAAFGLIALLFTDPRERASAVGIFGGVAGLGGTLGPVISGLLLSAASWRWIFFVNIPVAVICVLAVSRLVAESRAERHPDAGRPDIEGAVLGTAGVVGIVYALIAAGNHPWGSVQVIASLMAGAVALGTFALRERGAPDPLVPRGFLGNRTRLTANISTVFFASVFFTMFFLLTLHMQEVLNYSALRTGVAYLPCGLGIGFGIGLASAVVVKVGTKTLMVIGAVLLAAGVLLLSSITATGSYWSQVLPGLVVMSFGSGLSFAAFGNASMHATTVQDASLASGVESTAQQLGGAIGLALLATLALRHAHSAIGHGAAMAVAYTHGTVLALRIGAVVALVGGLVVALVPSEPAPIDIP